MKCNTAKIERERDLNACDRMMKLVLPAALLACDDIFCVTNRQTKMMLDGVAEILNGYYEEGDGAAELLKEANIRGIQISFKDEPFNQPAQKRYERANAVWGTIQLPDGKKRTICSRCERGTAVKEPYCPRCGADTRNSEQEVNIMPEWFSVKAKEPPENILLRVYASRPDAKRAGTVVRALYVSHTWQTSEPLPPKYMITHWSLIEGEKEREQ